MIATGPARPTLPVQSGDRIAYQGGWIEAIRIDGDRVLVRSLDARMERRERDSWMTVGAWAGLVGASR